LRLSAFSGLLEQRFYFTYYCLKGVKNVSTYWMSECLPKCRNSVVIPSTCNK